MEQWERHMPEERLAGQPQQYRGILSHGPKHGKIIEVLIRFSKNIDTLIF
jgi:hypothetical protein